jgi:hypothetical protein
MARCLGVGESCTRDANRGAAPRGANSVMSSPAPDTEGGTLLPDIPADTGEKFNRSSETKKTHGRSVGCITPQDVSNDGDEIHSRKLPSQLPHRASYP